LIGVLVQILTIASGLLVSFGLPYVYGIEVYGTFLQGNILIFFLQRIGDLTNEPLISRAKSNEVLFLALIPSLVIFVILLVINQFHQFGSLALMASMLISANVLLALHAQRVIKLVAIHLTVFVSLLLGLLCIGFLQGADYIDIVDLLIYSNSVSSFIGILVLIKRGVTFPEWNTLHIVFKNELTGLPKSLGFTFVQNTLVNILPFIASIILTARETGLFKLAISTLQASASLFPIALRSIYVEFVHRDNPEKLLKTVLGFSLIYFSILCASLSAVSIFYPEIQRYLIVILVMPIMFWVLVIERFLLAQGPLANLLLTNIGLGIFIIVVSLFMKNIQHAILILTFGISGYLLFLVLSSQIASICRIALPVAVISIIFTAFSSNLLITIVYYFLLISYSIFFMKFKIAYISQLKV
jgi:hypothetical protein